MAVRKRRAKIIWGSLSVVSLLALIIAALPLWFPWLLRPVAKRFGATYAQYRRVGYQRFQLSQLAFTNDTLQFQADNVRAFVPTVWLWKHLTGATNQDFLTIRSWQYSPVEKKSTPHGAPVSVHNTFQDLQSLSMTLRDWLPQAKLTNGIVSLGKQDLHIDGARWENGTLSATLSVTNEPPITVAAATKPNAPWTLTLAAEPQSLHSQFSIDDRGGKLAVTGSIDWRTNHLDLSAEFPARGYIPETASVRANAFTVPAHFLGLKEYGDVAGSLHAAWQTNHFTVQLAANAASPSTNLPPIALQLRASGNTNVAQLDVARISMPGLHADLSTPVALQFHPPYLSQPTTLKLAADLDRQQWFTATGKLTGKAVVSPGEKLPRISLTLAGHDIATTSITASNLAADADLDWPVLNLKSVNAVMDDASTVSLAGKYNLEKKSVEDGHLGSSGAFGGQFLPAGYSFKSASVTAHFAGPLATITHSATIHIHDVIVPDANPLDIDVTSYGEGLNLTAAQLTLKSGASSLLLRGSSQFEKNKKSLNVDAFEFRTSTNIGLRLQKPFQITFDNQPSTNSNSSSPTWRAEITPMQLSGAGGQFNLAADVSWPHQGVIQCDADGLDARLFKDFLPKADFDALLHHFHFAGGWTNGPMTFQLASDATLVTQEHLPFTADAKLTGGKSGVSIEQLSVSSATQIVCRAEGSLPVTFDPTRKDGSLQIDPDAPLKLQIFTDPHSVLWEKIAAATGLRLEEPNLTANLEGTWAAPQGRIVMRVNRIDFPQTDRPLPAIENIDLLAELNRTTAQISRFNFEVEKQPVQLTAQIPLGESFWAGLRHRHSLPDWHKATAHLTLQNAQIAPFATFLPQILSAEGAASADISLKPGGLFQGELSVTNARTHPLESIGPVRNIQLRARLEGNHLILENASGEIGGQRVNIDGSVELNPQFWRTNGLPSFQVHLGGTNVPLARNPSILLRANLDLTATNSGAAVPMVYGNVKLRDSLFLADLQTLVPERTASARKRPPYFSVDIDPWARWRLNVNVQGDKFLRVQTPLFHGTVSTVMTLQGTLKEPLALGQVKIDTGSSITFPFSSLDVKQGFISLTSEDPYRPTLFVDAEARRFGYDVKMEVTGPADQPVVKFTSIPGLSSEEIVLMLTAGQIPRGLGVTATTQQRAQGLALFVGKNLLSDFGLGGGGQDRLTIRSGEEISESGRPTYDIEYKLTDKWSVIGEYDRFDQYNLNLKYKLYSK